MSKFVVAFCTYNRATRLPALVAALRQQASAGPFEILAVNNNSTDETASTLDELITAPGAPLRVVLEPQPGIVPARNRALAEAINHDALLFIDDDELPQPGWVGAAQHAIYTEGADCAGGRVQVDFSLGPRPTWLSDDLLGFLAALDYGEAPFWVHDGSTPVWTSNVVYAMRLFREDPTLRFDQRFNRIGFTPGGGEDRAMFQRLITCGARTRYRPDMAVRHLVDAAKLKRQYFLKLHYRAGVRYAQHQMPAFERTIGGLPPFLLRQVLSRLLHLLLKQLRREPGVLREAMNITYALGCIDGYLKRPTQEVRTIDS